MPWGLTLYMSTSTIQSIPCHYCPMVGPGLLALETSRILTAVHHTTYFRASFVSGKDAGRSHILLGRRRRIHHFCYYSVSHEISTYT
jgi:hypothetical protein